MTNLLKIVTLLTISASFWFVEFKADGATVRKIIKTNLAPGLPGLPLSQAVQVGDTVYVAGQIGLTLEGEMVPGIENQTRLAIQHMDNILRAANSGLASVVKTSVLLADINDADAMNVVYREFFPDRYPARAAYQVGRLPMNALVEIEAVAISGELVDA